MLSEPHSSLDLIKRDSEDVYRSLLVFNGTTCVKKSGQIQLHSKQVRIG